MATSAQAFAALARLSPEDALAYLKARGQITKTWSWADLIREEHSHAFTISRLTNVDLLKDLQDMITKSVNGEMGRTDFMRDAKAALQAKGWWGEVTQTDPATGRDVTTTFNPQRLKLIYDTNTRQAYAAGQWERIQLGKASHPYLRYITKDDGRVRASHAQWHNLTLPVDHPFWQTHYPPNAWRCRCRVISVTQREYDKGKTPMGQDMLKVAPKVQMQDWTNPRTGEITQVPVGVHPSFAYNPGMARAKNMLGVVSDKMESLPKEVAGQLAQVMAASPAFKEWLSNPKDAAWPLARISDADAKAIGSRQSVVKLSEATARKQTLEHPELTVNDYAEAQYVVDNATIKVQEGASNLIYILQQDAIDAGGFVLVVKATKTGEGLFVTSYRRLSRDDAKRDGEIMRLLAKGQKK